MKKHGTITYTLTEEEYQQITYALSNLEDAIEYGDKAEAVHCIRRIREVLSSEN